MSHFFTKDKREQLALLNQYIDLTGGAPTAGQVLKAVADGDGNIRFAPGLDDTATGLPSGNEDEILRIVSGTAQFVDISGELLPAPSTAGQVLTVISTPDPDGGPDILSWQGSSLPSAPTSIADLVDPDGLAEGSIITISGGSWVTASGPSELPTTAADGDFLSYRLDLNSWEPAQPNMLEALRKATPARMSGDILKVQSAVWQTLGVAQADDDSGLILFGIGFDNEADWQAYSKDVHIRFRVDADQSGVFVGVDEMVDKAIVTIYAKFDGTDTIADIKAQFDDPSFMIAGLTVTPNEPDTTPVSGGDIGGGAGWSSEASSNNILYAYGSTVWQLSEPESLPSGNLDGQLLVWQSNNRVSEYHMISAVSIGVMNIQWKSEAKWREKSNPIQIKFVQDSGAGTTVSTHFDEYGNEDGICTWTLTSNWNFEAGGVAQGDVITTVIGALNFSSPLDEYIEVTGSGDVSPLELGFAWSSGSGIVDGSEGSTFMLYGVAGWNPEQPTVAATNMLTDSQGIVVINEDQLVMGATYDLNLVGHEMVVVLNDWATATGEIELRLKNGLTGQQVFIKNLSNAEQYATGGAANRVIKVKAGDGGTGSGMIDLESGVGFVIDPMVDMHLVCINGDHGMSGDGEWIIL